jgi:hypothetical protein
MSVNFAATGYDTTRYMKSNPDGIEVNKKNRIEFQITKIMIADVICFQIKYV